MRHVLSLLLALAAGSAAAEEAAPRPDGRILGKAALVELVSGATLYGERSDGTEDIEYHHPDGRSAYWYEGCLYRGQWWADDQQLCYLYPTTDWPGPHCFAAEVWQGSLFMVGGGEAALDLLSIEITGRTEGNSESFPLDAEGGCELVSMLDR